MVQDSHQRRGSPKGAANFKQQKVCFLSVDVEHDVSSFNNRTFRGVERMDEILSVFDHAGVSSTLFITGDILERYAEQAKQWAVHHEIASHGYSHTYLDRLHMTDVRKEFERFIVRYREIFGVVPRGFRAPSHVTGSTIMRTVEESGFLYDSSIVPHYPPFKKYRGYGGRAPKEPYHPQAIACRRHGDMNLLEIPVAGQLFGVPLAGAWLRGIPYAAYPALFAVSKPQFISLSMHSWDILLDDSLLDKVSRLMVLLQRKGYVFKRGDEIVHEYFSYNR